MKPKLLFLFFVFALVIGCSKDNNNSKPSISLKSYSSLVPPQGIFSAEFDYSQSGGNLSNDSLVIIIHRYNQTQVPPDNQRPDTLYTTLPSDVVATDKASFKSSMLWENLAYQINDENDTFDFKYILIDNKGNHSDTVKTGKVVVLFQ